MSDAQFDPQGGRALAHPDLEDIFVGIDFASLRARNRPAPQRSKSCHAQTPHPNFTGKIAFCNSQGGALTFKGPVQIIRYMNRQGAHVLPCAANCLLAPARILRSHLQSFWETQPAA